jgi:transposase InsO family protein
MVMAVSERRACRAVGQHRSTQRRPVPPNPYRDRLHREGWTVGNRLMKRVWRAERRLVPPSNAKQRRKRRRIGTGENGIKRRRATRKNEVCGMDFVQDRTADGRPFRMLVVLDEYTRECLTIEVQRNFGGEDVVAFLDELTAIRGAPAHVRSDNGPEFISAAVKKWCEESGTETLYIDPA